MHCPCDEGGGGVLYSCELVGEGGGSAFLLLSWGRVADGVAPYFCSVEHFWHDDGIVEVACEAAGDPSALMSEAA